MFSNMYELFATGHWKPQTSVNHVSVGWFNEECQLKGCFYDLVQVHVTDFMI